MAQVIFNGLSSKAITLNSYSRTTQLDENQEIYSSAYMQITPDSTTINTLTELMQSGITNIVIKGESGSTIYVLNNLAGKITSIQENYDGGNTINVYLNLTTNTAPAAPSGN